MAILLKIKDTLKRSSIVMNCYEETSKKFRAFLYAISPAVLAKYSFFIKKKRLPNLKEPQSFDEKLMWLMLYWRHPLKEQCADKYAVRSYVNRHGFGDTLPTLLGIYEKSVDIDFDNLPERFVLKCTHGCGFNIICKNKNDLDREEARRKLNLWMKVNISKTNGEVHYANITPRIICENYLDDLTGEVPDDYKVYCFSGKAHCILVCKERGLGGRATFDFYDRGWNNKLPYSKTSVLANRSIPKPKAYEQIMEAAEKLSKPFPFVRVDFYSINSKAVFGEMTFTPNGCADAGYTDVGQYELGRLIKLPRERLE